VYCTGMVNAKIIMMIRVIYLIVFYTFAKNMLIISDLVFIFPEIVYIFPNKLTLNRLYALFFLWLCRNATTI